jgi:succinate dehydrogenase/fumarate reductase flavoprotein subunit
MKEGKMSFNRIPNKVVETDVLVIGGGIAGCFAAIKAREQGVDVTLVDKGYVGKAGQTPQSNTFAAFNPELHNLKDWVNVVTVTGEYLNDRDWTEIVFKNAWNRWQDLCSWGLEVYKWDRFGNVFQSPAINNDGETVIIPLNPYGEGDKQHMQAPRHPLRKHAELLRKQAEKVGVKIMDRTTMIDLFKQDGRIVGAVGISPDSNHFLIFRAKATVLCSGPAGLKASGLRCMSTGDSDGMAYRAGCTITGKEWEEMHPVRADFPAWPWASMDRDRFRSFRDERKPNTPTFNAEGQNVGMHWSRTTSHHLEALQAHAGKAPTLWEVNTGMSEFFIMNRSPKGYPRKEIDDIAEKRGRVRMVFGRAIGQSQHVSDGIWPINKKCAAELPGLYAAGDSLGARASGAAYPGQGFATATCSTTGAIAGEAAAEYAKMADKPEVDEKEIARAKEYTFTPHDRKGGFSPAWVTQVMQGTMFPYWVLYVKHAERLQLALQQIEYLRKEIIPKLTARDFHELRLAHETANMALSAEMKLKASLMRKESRGAHYREDYPMRKDPEGLAWIKIKEENGKMTFCKEVVPEKWWPDASLPYEKKYPVVYPGEDRIENRK